MAVLHRFYCIFWLRNTRNSCFFYYNLLSVVLEKHVILIYVITFYFRVEKVEIPKVEGDVSTLPPPYTVRVLFLYGRNNCPLQFQKQDVSRLTLCVPMDSSFWFYTITLGWSFVYIEGSQVIISPQKLYFFLSEDRFCLSKQCRP